MKAQVCRNFGSIENLNYLDTPDPTPKNDEILIKVRAIGVNFADSLLVQGKYQASPPLPFVPGTEASGEIIALGTNCKKYKVGDRVYGYNQAFGAFAEKVVFKEKIVSRLPENLSFDESIRDSFREYLTESFRESLEHLRNIYSNNFPSQCLKFCLKAF